MGTLPVFYEFAAQGQSVFQASGDFGVTNVALQDNRSFDAITLVGGTVLSLGGSPEARQAEGGWSKTGGGVYPNVPIPNYQVGVPTLQSTTSRNSPDVAAMAGFPGADIYAHVGSTNAVTEATGGTSAAAPLWAGFMALVNTKNATFALPSAGFANPALYAIGKSDQTSFFNDISDNALDCTVSDLSCGSCPSGQVCFNGSCIQSVCFNAVSGYDLLTGWGSPKCSLVAELACPTTCGGALCVDLNSDPNNCGTCGNICPGTGDCSGGACHVPITLASTVQPAGLTLDATNVYWTDGASAFTVPKHSPGAVTVIVQQPPSSSGLTEPPWSVAVDSNAVFWTGPGVIWSAPLTGAVTPTTLVNVANGDALAVQTDGAHVYWADTGDVWSLPVAGGTPVSLTPLNNAAEPFGFAISPPDGFLAATALSEVFSLPLVGGGPTVIANPLNNPTRLATFGGTVYFATAGGPIMAVPMAGGAVTPVTTTANQKVVAIAADAANVYWATATPPAGIFRVPITGGTSQLIASAQEPVGLALDSDAIYWSDFSGNVVMSLAK